MRIILICDQKWRDLPNLVVIKLALEELNHRVLLVTTKDQQQMIRAFRPDCVVFNHLFAPANQTLAAALQKSGIAVVILPTEGAVRPEYISIANGEFAREWPMDLFLAWSEVSAAGVRSRWGVGEEIVKVIGCPRFDFYTNQYSSVVATRDDFCRKYGLDPLRPIVTWATAFGYADIHKDPSRLGQFMREIELNGVAICNRRIGIEPLLLPEMFSEARSKTMTAFEQLAKHNPNIQFIIKPHPVDNRDFYKSKIRSFRLDNVRFCPEDYIWNVLAASDLHLHRQCTTAVEAWMWHKPTIEMAMDGVEPWRWKEREKGSDVAENVPQLIDLVAYRLKDKNITDPVKDFRRNYIEIWFGKQDGMCSLRAAIAIDDLLTRRGEIRSYTNRIYDLEASWRSTLSAVVRYLLEKRPSEPIFSKSEINKIDPFDKLVTNKDVRAYEQLVMEAVKLIK